MRIAREGLRGRCPTAYAPRASGKDSCFATGTHRWGGPWCRATTGHAGGRRFRHRTHRFSQADGNQND